jgi:peptide/nickel transport system substrate-binding protein
VSSVAFPKFRPRGIPGIALVVALGGCLACGRPRSGPASRLDIALPYEVTTLDPHATFTLSNLAILFNFYETLVAFDPDMRLTPSLARSWENPDPETWIFHLRPDVRFHDGRALDSSDVKFSFDRLLRRTDLEMSGFLLSIERVDAVDPLTLRIRTRNPSAILLNKIAYVAIVPRDSTDAGLAGHVDGTGPYRLGRFRPDAIEMVRNDRYRGPRPYAAVATYRLDTPPERALERVRSGASELAQCNTRSALAPGPRSSYRVLKTPDLFVKHLAYKFPSGASPPDAPDPRPFGDIRVRRAVDLAIDRDELAANLPAPAVPVRQLALPFIFGFDASLQAPRCDRAEAARLLTEAGYPRGFDVVFDVRRIFEPAAREVARQLARVQIRARIRVHSDLEFASVENRRAMAFFLDRFGCATGDASDILDNVVHTADPARHYGIFNTVGYSNPALDRLIEESGTIADPTPRRALLQTVVGKAMQDLVLIPLYADEDIYAMDRSLAWRPRNDGMVLAAEVHAGGREGSEARP